VTMISFVIGGFLALTVVAIVFDRIANRDIERYVETALDDDFDIHADQALRIVAKLPTQRKPSISEGLNGVELGHEDPV
jgi:hypothetical protein